MEIALLARGYALLVAALIDAGVLERDDELVTECRAIAQTYLERARAHADYHKSARGVAALERADDAAELDAAAESLRRE